MWDVQYNASTMYAVRKCQRQRKWQVLSQRAEELLKAEETIILDFHKLSLHQILVFQVTQLSKSWLYI